MTTSNPHSSIIPDLPDDVAARCIALLPLSSHPLLSLVSRSWHALFRSHLFFSLRSQLHTSEPILFISIRSSSFLFCFLFRPSLPDHTIRRIPSPPISSVGSACCPCTTNICLIGGSYNDIPTRNLQTFSLTTNRWSIGPSMSTAREFCAAGLIDGRIHVLGGCLPSAHSWAERYEPTTSKWASVSSPTHIREKWMHGSTVLGGKLLGAADRGGLMFDPRTLDWASLPVKLDLGWKGRAAEVGGVLYTYDYMGGIKGYDPVMDEWRQVEGLERSMPKFLCGATLSELGGLLCLVWEERKMCGRKMGVSCAGIEVCETKDGGGLVGCVRWLDNCIVDVSHGSTITHCVSLYL